MRGNTVHIVDRACLHQHCGVCARPARHQLRDSRVKGQRAFVCCDCALVLGIECGGVRPAKRETVAAS